MGTMTEDYTLYRPTRERVEVFGIANGGQVRPGDPGSGMRLYAVRFPDGSTGQASAAELASCVNGKAQPFEWRGL